MSCWRCNSVYLAKRMRDLLATQPPQDERGQELIKAARAAIEAWDKTPEWFSVPVEWTGPMNKAMVILNLALSAASAPAQQAEGTISNSAQFIADGFGASMDSQETKAAHVAAILALVSTATQPQPVAEEGVTDAPRLDWLARNLFAYKWNGVIDSGSRTDWFVRGDHRHTMQKMNGTTLREAIDAAMAGTGSDESKESGNG